MTRIFAQWTLPPASHANRPIHATLRAVAFSGQTMIDAHLLAELREVIGDDGMVLRATELKVFECDGWTLEKSAPEILLRPRTTAEVSAILKLLNRRGIAFVRSRPSPLGIAKQPQSACSKEATAHPRVVAILHSQLAPWFASIRVIASSNA